MKTRFLLFCVCFLGFSITSLQTKASSRPAAILLNIDQPCVFAGATTEIASLKIESAETIRSGNIPFPIQSASLSGDAKIILNGIATDLKNNLASKAIIKGHGGGDRTLEQLGDDRIYNIIAYMSENHQLDSSRFITSVDSEQYTDSVNYSLSSDGH